jgi:phage terminase small subunit
MDEAGNNRIVGDRLGPDDQATGSPLRPRELAFVHAYVAGPIGTRGVGAAAAQAAGYQSRSRQALAVRASKLLATPRVQAAIHGHFDRLELTTERVLREISAIAFSDITDVIEWDHQEVQLHPSVELPGLVTTAIARIDQTAGPAGQSVRVRMHDKIGALKLLAKILRLGEEPSTSPVEAVLSRVKLGRLSPQELEMLESLLVKAMNPGPQG